MSLVHKLRALLPDSGKIIPDQPVSYRPIGIVRSRRREAPSYAGQAASEIVLRPELESALEDIDGFSHLIVVFHLDRVPEAARRDKLAVSTLQPEPRGVLATRSQLRPNPIGVSVVRLVRRRGRVLRVRGLDALNGSPVLDIKPYLPPYDSVPDARLPGWAVEDEAQAQ